MNFSKAWDKAKPVKANELKKKESSTEKKKKQNPVFESAGTFGTKEDAK